ncbi:MAG: heme-binding domain-containing protein [Saprospiraceae bacterium]|nr:heme-binding domain-containing protein [Saprospiraceae bacterium]
MNKIVKMILLVLVGLIVIAQFFRIDKTAPAVNTSQDFLTLAAAPADVAALVRDACYDCHSYESKYPWYSNVAPVSWWVKNHINEGRENLNFSIYDTYSPEDKGEILEECAEVIQEGEMPLKSYTWMHPEARITDAQRQQLISWLETMNGGERMGEYQEEEDED